MAAAFFFNDTATTEIYTLSLHDALPISQQRRGHAADLERREVRLGLRHRRAQVELPGHQERRRDRKSTRLNSSHGYISYAVFCFKKKTLFSHYGVYDQAIKTFEKILPSS